MRKASIVFASLLIFATCNALAEDIPPDLTKLYNKYPSIRSKLDGYVISQGINHPLERRMTVIHELIHIDSAAKKGFFYRGQYIEPYLNTSYWPALNNAGVLKVLMPEEVKALGAINDLYLTTTPSNRLGNVLDEINAYSQTVPILCRKAPGTANKHIAALSGHLALIDVYMRVLHESDLTAYVWLANSYVARGALETIVANGYSALNECRDNPESNPASIPKAHISRFAALPKPKAG